jgi:hypothetical protein
MEPFPGMVPTARLQTHCPSEKMRGLKGGHIDAIQKEK